MQVDKNRARRIGLAQWACGSLALAVLLTVGVQTGFGQQRAGTLTGTVADNSGAVVPNAKITLRDQQSGDLRRTVTNADGYFTMGLCT